MLPFDYLYYVSAGLTTCCVCANKELITESYYELEFSPIKERTSLPLVFRNGLYSFTIEQSDIPDDYLIEHQIPIYKNDLSLEVQFDCELFLEATDGGFIANLVCYKLDEIIEKTIRDLTKDVCESCEGVSSFMI